MLTFTGKSVCSGLAVGPVHLYEQGALRPPKLSVLTPGEELDRFSTAVLLAGEELASLYEEASPRLGEDVAAVFQIQSVLLEDPDFLDAAHAAIQDGACAEYAAYAAGEECAELLLATQDVVLSARAADIRDAARRLVRTLSGQPDSPMLPSGILAVWDLSPSDALHLDPHSVLGLVSSRGSSSSHTAILARALGIPYLIGVDPDPAWENRMAVLDGEDGLLYIDPDQTTLTEARARQSQAVRPQAPDGPCVSKDGKRIEVCVNIASPDQVRSALELGADGVGLFRSEYLYLGRDTCPTEEEQYRAYRQTVLSLEGRRLVIRTLDAGADKQAPCLAQPREENPALGCRGVRYSLLRPHLLRTQLRAILRAAACGPVSIMFPMVTCARELRQVKSMLEQCRDELRAQNLPFGTPEVGTMIETPAAVVMADELAQEADFFSLGTNDLTQYTLAADRQNPSLDAVRDDGQEAVLRMIAHTVRVAHEHGLWVGICGEMAADPELCLRLLSMGVDELSVSPASVPLLRAKIATLELAAL